MKKRKDIKHKDADKRILLMWSGGIDSTYRLAHTLIETDHYVHAHFIKLHNREDRADAEEKSVMSLIKALKKVRTFGFTFSRIEHPTSKYLPRDVMLAALEAGVTARNLIGSYKIALDYWCLGDPQLGQPDWLDRTKQMQKIVGGIMWPMDPVPYFEHKPLTKKEDEVLYLHQHGLLNKTWWCRFPVKESTKFKPCGKCVSCKQTRGIFDKHQIKWPTA